MVGDVTLAGFTFSQDDWLLLDDETHARILEAWSHPPAPPGSDDYYEEFSIAIGE